MDSINFCVIEKLRITWHRQNRKSWSRVRIPRHGPIFHLHIIKIWQMKRNTYMHFKEKSIIYISSKFQLDTCMFDSNIVLTKFGSGFWFRVRGVGPGFYSFPTTTMSRCTTAIRIDPWNKNMVQNELWKMKRSKNEHLQASVSQYLKRRQFPVWTYFILQPQFLL